MNQFQRNPVYYSSPFNTLVGPGILLILFFGLYFEIITLLISQWLGSEAYSHGIMIPFISMFLIWQKHRELAKHDFTGSWIGITLLVLGIIVYLLGHLAALQIFLEYSFLLVILGTVWAVAGNPIFKQIWIPISFFFFAIPLPAFLYNNLSAKLQLISSQIGVAFIRLWDISVYLEGNVIDLGSMRLQVAEACSGLNYLFPLMSVAFICAYFFQAPLWKRAIIFFSSIPITVLMNSFRIGMIGILVEYWGKSMAEGFLHDFEGWIVFMGCTAILIFEIWLLTRLSKDPRPMQEVFGLVLPEPWPENTQFQPRQTPKQTWVSAGLLLLALALSYAVGNRQEIIPQRVGFDEFPMNIGEWQGRRLSMEQEYVDTLKFTDYLLADFHKAGEKGTVNLYSAFYASQRQGASIHSPRACLPGGGWDVKSMEVVSLDLGPSIGTLNVNRALIQKGDQSQLVYFWFPQRGRNITNEYLAKWYLFWDGITRNRTDGALVRYTLQTYPGDDIGQAEQSLQNFMKVSLPKLKGHLPD